MNKQNMKNITVTDSENSQRNSKYPSKWTMILSLTLVCMLLYSNTLFNNYCLDDVMVITENTNTLKGFEGIKEHFTKDYLYGYMHKESQNPLSPWRPLSLVSFSLEIGIWGINHPGYSHLINVLLYTLITILLFTFLCDWLLKDKWLAFFTAMLFALHPIHTEVVANIKSRDELLCLLFLLGSLHLLWKHIGSNKKYYFFFSLLFFFLSLLSKETSITFVAGIPIMLYFFSDLQKKKLISITSWFLLSAVLYLLIRFSVFNQSPADEDIIDDGFVIINYPFLFAEGNQAFFTKIFILLKYLKLLVFPNPLCFDYSYNQIPYVDGTNIFVWVSFLVYGFLIFIGIKNFKKKNVLSFSILLFLITFSLVSNLFFDIAVTIGERLLFIPSIFFCIAVVQAGNIIFNAIVDKISINKKILVVLTMLPITVFSAVQVIDRNKDWKDMDTLNFADYPKSSNSVRMNDALGNYYLRKATSKKISSDEQIRFLNMAIPYYKKAIELYPAFENDLINIAICYEKLGNFKMSETYWNKLNDVAPNNTHLKDYNNHQASVNILKGVKCNEENRLDSSYYYLSKAIKSAIYDDSITVQAYYHIAGLYYKNGKYQEAHDALGKVLSLDPNNKTALMGFKSCEEILKSKNN